MKKRISLLVLITFFIIGLLVGCTGGTTSSNSDNTKTKDTKSLGDGTKSSETVEIWSFLNQEEMNYYQKVYSELRPDAKVKVTVFPGDQYLTKIQAALRTGTNAPDIVYMEISHLGQFKETGMLENLANEPYNAEEIMKNQVPYVTELSRNSKGEIMGLSWQATPGGFWFRKDLAKKYLGTDDPDEFYEMVKDWEKIIETGKKVYAESNGEVSLLDDAAGTVGSVMLNTKGGPWVDENNKLISSDVLKNILTVMKEVRDNNVDSKLGQWTAGWSSAMFTDSKYIIVGLPSWGLHYCIKANTPPEKHGDAKNMWGFVQAPAAYQSGGTWLSMYSKSNNKEAAWDYIKTMTANEDYLIPYLINELGDFTSHIPSIEKTIANDFRDPFTGDQNVYSALYKAAMKVEATPMTKYDSQCNDSFGAQRDMVLEGSITIDQAIEAFKKDIKNIFPEVIID